MKKVGAKMSVIYAIVDLETTGTDVQKDQIIQFACTLVQDNRILHTFTTDINPGFAIPKTIANLTGLTNRRLVKAPYFEDVALMIENLLADTIFVAHNVHFDYQFLSNTFVKYGFDALTIPAIDTVDLAQIFLPTQPSYRLNDLVTNLGIEHTNPHQADSDSMVTAELFLKIVKIIEHLPLKTLSQISKRCNLLSMQTGEFLQRSYEIRQLHNQSATAHDKLVCVEDIWVKAQQIEEKTVQLNKHYPKTKKAKEKLIGQPMFNEQAKMMNLIYQNRYSMMKEEQPTELTLDVSEDLLQPVNFYFPISFFEKEDFPIILGYESESWFNRWQKISSTLHELNQLQQVHYYPDEQYIDLQKFAHSLEKIPDQKLISILQMMILVWLTQTDTGSLVELGLYNETHTYFQEIHCQSAVLTGKPYFLNQREKMLASAEVVLFRQKDVLLSKAAQTFSKLSYKQLYFVEAQYLLPLQKMNHQEVDIQVLNRYIGQVIKDDSPNQQVCSIRNVLSLIRDFQHQVFDQWVSIVQDHEITEHKLANLPQTFQRHLDQLIHYYQELLKLVEEKDLYSIHTHFYLIIQDIQTLLAWFLDLKEGTVHTWQLEKNHLIFRYFDFSQVQFSYPTNQRLIFVGSHLSLAFQKNYFAEKLSLENQKVKTLKTKMNRPEPQIEVVEKGISIPEVSSEIFGQYITKILMNEVFASECSTLVLFNSQEVMQLVYQQFNETATQAGIELLAVGQNANLAKIKKRYEGNKNQFVFLLNKHLDESFLTDLRFERILLTRLPFNNPKEWLTQAYYSYLDQLGVDSFYHDALPTAGIRLARCLDLLTASSQGKLLILDKRIISTVYGRKLQKILPNQWQYVNYDFEL